MKNPLVKWAIIILVILLVDIVGGYYIGRNVLIPMMYNTGETESAGEEAAESGETQESSPPGQTVQLEAINLNPADSAGEIFSCEMTLEAENPQVIEELNTRSSQIRDIIITYLSYKTVRELNDVSQRETYRRDLMKRINDVLTSGEITNVFITQWILQFS